MAGNDWINSYLEAILDSGTPVGASKSSLLLRERGRFSPTRYFVEEVITGFDETDLYKSWVRAAATRSPQERNTRLENMCWRIWNLARKKKQQIRGETHGILQQHALTLEKLSHCLAIHATFENRQLFSKAMASYDLRFWHPFFEMPGCNNDLNILNRSPLFNNILDGCAPRAEFVINNHNYDHGYYLVVGIYPPLTTIVKTYSAPDTPKKKKIVQMQEATRKDVKRAFGVLQEQFAIVKGPARLWDVDSLSYIMKTCNILHNMIVEDEREEGISDYEYNQQDGSNFTVPKRDGLTERATRNACNVQLHDRQRHHVLCQDLIEHIWNQYGDDEN